MPSIALPVSLRGQLLSGTRSPAATFNPSALFALAEPGIWLDPSDVANLDWQRNLLLWSEQFDNAYWVKAQTTVPTTNDVLAPNGTMTAEKIVESLSASLDHTVRPPNSSISYVAGTTYTLSAYFKAAERTWVNLQLPSVPFTTAKRAWFDLENGVRGSVSTGATSNITPVGGGWYRCSMTTTATTTNIPTTSAVLGLATADGGQAYEGDGTSGAYFWGAQLEAGTLTDYQPITDLNTEVLALFPNATMFQDRAGTTPVTTPGQFVGVRRDKSGNAKHAVAPTDAARMTYGIEPKTGTRNILTFSEQFDNAIWVKTGTTITANASTAPDGTLTADKLVMTAATGLKRVGVNAVVTVGQSYTDSVYAKAAEISTLVFRNTASEYVTFDLASNSATSTGTFYTAAYIEDVGDGWKRCSAAFTPTVTPYAVFYGPSTGNTTGNDVDGILIWGAQLELGSTATAYQRVTVAFDVTEAGVASCHYCQFDGTDDSMSTASIDFTSTDAMSVFAGVWKRTDAALGTLMELSATAQGNNGSFFIRAPATNGAANYQYYSGGTARVAATAGTSFPAPIYNLLTGYNDISDDQIALRVNGVQVATSTADQGTGNFGNHPLFIGRRNSASNPFSGRDYGIIVVGKAVSAGDLASTETWLAAKTPGVTL